jgi:hypothetical protein
MRREGTNKKLGETSTPPFTRPYILEYKGNEKRINARALDFDFFLPFTHIFTTQDIKLGKIEN